MRSIRPHVPAEGAVVEVGVPAGPLRGPVGDEVDATGNAVADGGPLGDVGVGGAFESGDEGFALVLIRCQYGGQHVRVAGMNYWYLEVSIAVPVLVQQSQDISRRPRQAATLVVEGEEELEAVSGSSGGLKCQVLFAYLSKSVCGLSKHLGHLTTCVDVVPASGGAMFKAKASIPLLAPSLMSDSQFEAVYAPLFPT